MLNVAFVDTVFDTLNFEEMWLVCVLGTCLYQESIWRILVNMHRRKSWGRRLWRGENLTIGLLIGWVVLYVLHVQLWRICFNLVFMNFNCLVFLIRSTIVFIIHQILWTNSAVVRLNFHIFFYWKFTITQRPQIFACGIIWSKL